MNTDAIVAVMGLTLVVLELYFKGLSLRVEGALAATWAGVRLLQERSSGILSGYGGALRSVGNNFFSLRVLVASFGSALVALAVVLAFGVNLREAEGPVLWVLGVLAAPYFLWAGMWVLYVVLSVASLWVLYIYVIPIIFISNKTFEFLNFIGRGKALGGVGLLIAVYGVLGINWFAVQGTS